MGDILGLSKSVEKLVEPVNKLIDAITGACGKCYEPSYVRRMARAHADEMKIIAEATRKNADLEVLYQGGIVRVGSSTPVDLAGRAINRWGYVELQKQRNIEKVIDKAYDNLKNTEAVIDKPVDKMWMSHFMEHIGHVEESTIQQIWANILSSEVKEPGSYSIRTMDTLSRLTKDEAELFGKIAPWIQIIDQEAYVIGGHFKMQYDIPILEITKLSDSGLLMSERLLCEVSSPQNVRAPFFHNKKYFCFVYKYDEGRGKIAYEAYKLTRAGGELYHALNIEPDFNYLTEMLNFIANENHQHVFSIHEIEGRDGDSFQLSETDIFRREIQIRLPKGFTHGTNSCSREEKKM